MARHRGLWLRSGWPHGDEVRLAPGRQAGHRHRHRTLSARYGKAHRNAEILKAAENDPVEAIRDLTEGRGADVCVDAVGMEANRNLLDKLSNIISRTGRQH